MNLEHTSISPRDNVSHTVPTGPNLTESGPKPDLGFAFALADPDRTPTGSKANPERTQSEPQFQKRTCKADTGFALRNRAVNQDYW